MLSISFSSFPILHTPRLLLREMTADDAQALFEMRSDERVMRYLGRPLQKDVHEAVEFIEKIRASFAENESVAWGISFHGDSKLLGNISFWKMDKANHRTEIGYMLHPDYWRQGIMDEAMTAALDYCFRVLNFHSVEANTDPQNEASGRLLEKHGFVQEAYFRENLYFEGRFLDSRIYSKINPFTFAATTHNPPKPAN
ncbi:MAG: GNAT family N-acetyltransferase [Thermoanaerobaculia bacterium]|nr:GNAT family N-acetyltransferase [Thermoanaerobaculia bacterium]